MTGCVLDQWFSSQRLVLNNEFDEQKHTWKLKAEIDNRPIKCTQMIAHFLQLFVPQLIVNVF